jgi:hypothetical protein
LAAILGGAARPINAAFPHIGDVDRITDEFLDVESLVDWAPESAVPPPGLRNAIAERTFRVVVVGREYVGLVIAEKLSARARSGRKNRSG